ncbi:MAG TPA: hypothetical protein VER11_11960 [Polyangiaceae bacterium]|nr:hypothetical protein [Polyangiaceae bacterium]
MRLLPTSLALVGLTVAAGLAGCGSDSSRNFGGTSGAPSTGTAGSGSVSTAGKPGVSSAGSAGATVGGGTAGSGNTGNTTAGSSGSVAGSSSVAGAPNNTGGSSGSGNTTSTGGSTGTAGGGNAGGGAVDPNAPDKMGKTNAKPGDKTSTKLDYLKMGDIRLINNNWGSVAWNCTDKSPSSVFINADKTFGWSFDRPDCDTGNTNTKPDFPEIEFGIHPFGLGSSDATSPNFSTTTLLPKQVKDITSATVTIDSLNINLSSEGSWDLTFEFWLSTKDPATTQGNAGVYAELMTFWGWQANRWPLTGMTGANSPQCDIACKNGLSAGSKSYDLIVQRNSWGSGWQYFQFRGTDGSQKNFNGTVDVKKLLDYLMGLSGYSKDMYLTRLEVGSEIDDNTKGTVTMKNITFEINGEKRSPVFGQ